MNSSPESDQPVQPAEGSEPDDLQRVLDQGHVAGVPTPEEEAAADAEAAAKKARGIPTQLTDLGDNADELTGFNLRMD